jgi:ubiquinone biosynthesis protein UbiJ
MEDEIIKEIESGEVEQEKVYPSLEEISDLKKRVKHLEDRLLFF